MRGRERGQDGGSAIGLERSNHSLGTTCRTPSLVPFGGCFCPRVRCQADAHRLGLSAGECARALPGGFDAVRSLLTRCPDYNSDETRDGVLPRCPVKSRPTRSNLMGRDDQADPPIPADSVGCRLFEHWTSSAERIRLLASSPKVRSQPSFANSFWISFQLSNLPVFARKTARRYISSLRLRITHPCTINRWFGIGSWRPSIKLHLEPRRMSINVSRMSKAYMAIQRQYSRTV
jgi:hypothetical protein